MVVRRLTEANRTERVVPNPLRNPGFKSHGPDSDPILVHRKLPGYEPTPLIELPVLARELGLEHLWLKDESSRIGLPAFKILGASYAVVRAVQQRLGLEDDAWDSLNDLAQLARPLQPMTLACATDGNHGRAVARMARWLGFEAIVLVPEDMSPARIEAIASEGAEVRTIDGTYDDAIGASAELASDTCMVISDTAWPGYEDIPGWVIDGYATILREVDDQLAAAGASGPDLVSVQIGVGALATAVCNHYRRADDDQRPMLIGVEPTRAACTTASIESRELVQIPGPYDSIMSGLNCGTPSPLAWPVLSQALDTMVAIDDERARVAMRDLASAGVVAGECGAAGLAGLQVLRTDPQWPSTASSALVISSEGATDLAAYERIVGKISSC
jgi:diaminopropionate ammonia-lyase